MKPFGSSPEASVAPLLLVKNVSLTCRVKPMFSGWSRIPLLSRLAWPLPPLWSWSGACRFLPLSLSLASTCHAAPPLVPSSCVFQNCPGPLCVPHTSLGGSPGKLHTGPARGQALCLWYTAAGPLPRLGVVRRCSCISDLTFSTAVKALRETASFQYVEACSVENLEENPSHWKLIPGSHRHEQDWMFRRARCVPGSVRWAAQ